MSCHGCAVKFGVFTKEHGCPSCGFSYCKKCLRYKTVIPKLGSSTQNVCRVCYEMLSSNQNDDVKKEQPSPPAVFLRRLESLENPSRPPITVYQHNTRMEKLKTGLTPEDQEIVERLEKLREERKRHRESVPTEEDIVRRLAALKGNDSDHALQEHNKKKEVFHLPDTRSDEEKTNDLIKQLIQEQILSVKRMSTDELIARRLARLRGEQAQSADSQSTDVNIEELAAGSEKMDVETTDDVKELMKQMEAELNIAQKELRTSAGKMSAESENDANDDAEVNDIVDKVMKEASLDELEEFECKESSDGQEQPWCIICNEDATKQCPDCDNDLFCDKCFTEYHSDPEIKDHSALSYKLQKKA